MYFTTAGRKVFESDGQRRELLVPRGETAMDEMTTMISRRWNWQLIFWANTHIDCKIYCANCMYLHISIGERSVSGAEDLGFAATVRVALDLRTLEHWEWKMGFTTLLMTSQRPISRLMLHSVQIWRSRGFIFVIHPYSVRVINGEFFSHDVPCLVDPQRFSFDFGIAH